MTDEKVLEQLVKDTFSSSSTFSEEIAEKIRKELLKMANEAEAYYSEKSSGSPADDTSGCP